MPRHEIAGEEAAGKDLTAEKIQLIGPIGLILTKIRSIGGRQGIQRHPCDLRELLAKGRACLRKKKAAKSGFTPAATFFARSAQGVNSFKTSLLVGCGERSGTFQSEE